MRTHFGAAPIKSGAALLNSEFDAETLRVNPSGSRQLSAEGFGLRLTALDGGKLSHLFFMRNELASKDQTLLLR